MARKTYEESCKILINNCIIEGEIPPLPEYLPKFDDEITGVSFYKTNIDNSVDLSNMTLPRTFIGRSEINNVNFINTDFSESNMCWNDFNDVAFNNAVLKSSDLRSSNFNNVKFDNCDLTSTDFRHSSLINCSFEGAILKNTKINKFYLNHQIFSQMQIDDIDWIDNNGPEPDGG